MIPAETITAAREKSILDVAMQCGADLKKTGAEWKGPCPGCGGTDRFWVDESKNVFLCRMSGAGGDPIALLQHKHGCGFGEAVEMLTGERSMPVAERRAATPDKDDAYREKARRRAWKIWRNGFPIDPAKKGRLVREYFARRKIPFPKWPMRVLREADHLDYWMWSKSRQEFIVVHSGPAMLAAVTGPDGRFIGVHRTWLDLNRPDGKAVIADPETGEILAAKKVEGSQRGGKIALRDCAGSPAILALGEGIETVLSWDVLHGGTPALWCGLNLDNIAGKAAEQVPHPALTARDRLGRERRVKVGSADPDLSDTRCLQIAGSDFQQLVLLGDSDSDRFTTQAAMLRAQRRFAAAGHNASIDWAPSGHDWNDALRMGQERAVA